MNRMLFLACVALVSRSLEAGGMITGVVLPKEDEQFEFFPKDRVRMDVAFDDEFESVSKQADSFDTWIYCRWTNSSSSDVKLLLKDHDFYHGTLDYPWGIDVRVTNQAGKVITENSTIKNGWWTSSVIHSQISELMPGDAILLRPGESVVRCVPLLSVLMGLDLGEPERALPTDGEFVVELRLGDILATRPLSLRVKKRTEANQRTEPTRGSPAENREARVQYCARRRVAHA